LTPVSSTQATRVFEIHCGGATPSLACVRITRRFEPSTATDTRRETFWPELGSSTHRRRVPSGEKRGQ
jgi:hypothetical protein